MRYYFIDMEMIRHNKEKWFFDSKIIAIGYASIREDLDSYVTKRKSYPRINVITEWELKSEKRLLLTFYNWLKVEKYENQLTFIGYGINKYDIPLLIQRLNYYRFGSIEALNEFFHSIPMVDLWPFGFFLNNKRLKGSSLMNILSKISYFDPLLERVNITEKGSEVNIWYREKKYKAIEKHLIKDIKAIMYLYRYVSRLPGVLEYFFSKRVKRKHQMVSSLMKNKRLTKKTVKEI